MFDEVCKQEDGFLKNKPIWFVDLNNQERIFMDDGRPGVDPYQAWIRLKNYIRKNGLHIVRMYIKFRSHIECTLPENADGYFFKQKAVGNVSSGQTFNYMLIGYLEGDFVYIEEWKTPELIQTNTEKRTIDDIKDEPNCLILNNGWNDQLMENFW